MAEDHCSQEQENLRTVYAALVDYNGNLIHMRFSLAGLYLAGTGFLVGALFNDAVRQCEKLAVTLLGLLLTAITWLFLEVRTSQLLDNVLERGQELERELKLGRTPGFFALLKKQPCGPKWPFPFRLNPKPSTPPCCAGRYIVSHTVGLSLLYLVIAVFWMFMFCVLICYPISLAQNAIPWTTVLS